MEIEALRYVVTLAEELHFGRAAKRHYISPQPFGQRIQRLEREVGALLFERTSRRVSVTAAGERFVKRAWVILAELDVLREIAQVEDGSDDGVLRIGVLGFGAAHRWPALRDAVAAQQPALTLEYRDLDLVDQYDALRQREVDLAIVQCVGELDEVEFQVVLSSPRVAVVPAASELGDAPFLTFDDLSDRKWLDVGTREPLLQAWMAPVPESGTGPRVRHPAAIPTAVATTGRVSLHAAAAARFYPRPDVRFVPVEGAPVQVAVATRAGDRRPGVAAFRRAAAAVGGWPGDHNGFDC